MIPSDGYEWLHGGSFGIEGGLAMTIILGITITIFSGILIRRKESDKSPNEPSVRDQNVPERRETCR